MAKVAFWLVIIGAVNWLLVGLFGWDVGQLFGGMDALVSRVIYILVGLSGFVVLKGKGSSSPSSM